MSAVRVPFSSPPTALDTSSLSSQTSSLPLWDRISLWASENKAVVYTIAGVAVVVSGAGVVYYFSDSRKTNSNDTTEEKKRASKKERRKAKKDKDQEQEPAATRPVDEQSSQKGMLHFIPLVTTLTCSIQKAREQRLLWKLIRLKTSLR